MDSKYASLSAENGVKRNGSEFRNIKQKKLKNGTHCGMKVSNNNEIIENIEQNTTSSNIISGSSSCEDLQETKKNLPVYALKDSLLKEIGKNSTVILIGETGCGKTTQIPQMILEESMQRKGIIAVTQPRRVAAISVALRVADELNCKIGDTVGYSVRFEEVTNYNTKIKYMTDGMLLREAIVDPLLKKYSIVILDEAHERTISTDVLFGIVKLAQKQRLEQHNNPLKVIAMSATMDVDSFRRYFDECPVIYLEGRTYPVTIYHSKTKQEDYQFATVCTIFQLHEKTPPNHDFLVFLTGQEEIETVMYNIKEIAKEAPGPPLILCPLYANLPACKQLQVWKQTPPGMRKIVLATNIAEASVTIPQIRYVIDCGMVKERWWCSATGAERLRVAPCSQAAAWQRAGRAGRTAPGRAYRLYPRRELAARAPHTAPELVRCPLAPTILCLLAAGMEPTTFPLIDSPPPDSVKASLVLLKELGAIDNEVNPKLSPMGKKMSAFPIDPKYSKVILSATEYNCLNEILSLVAVLSSENIYHTPMHKREEALKVRQKFVSPLGDHITLLNIFKAFSKTTLKKQWCKENYLNQKNLMYASEVRQQLLNICQRLNMPMSSCGSANDQVLKCLLSGLFANCAWLRAGAGGAGGAGGGGRYVTVGGAAAALHPSSALHAARPPPAALLYGELLHTRRAYLLTASAIQPQWLHHAAPAFARRCRAPR